MTTATESANYVDFDEYVGLKLEKTRSTIRTTDVLTALAGVAAMFLGYLLVFVVLDQWVIPGGFGFIWRWVSLSLLVLSTIGWLVWKVGIPSFRTVNGLFAAQEIEKAEPTLKSNLLNLIDLKSAGRTVNPVILKAMERQAAVRLQKVDVTQAVDHRPLVHTAYLLLAVIVIFCFYALFSPKKISNSIWRGLFPAAEVPLATVTEILDVKPGDMTVPAHQPLIDIQVDLAGEIPNQVRVRYTTADGRQDQPIDLRSEQDGQTRFTGQLIGEPGQGLVQDVTYYVQAGDAVSRKFKVTVVQPPYADVEKLRIEFPNYTKMQPIEQVNSGAIDGWEGAKVVVDAKTNMPVRTGVIQFLDDPQIGPTGEEVVMSVNKNGRQLQATWALEIRSDGTFPKYYRIHCRTEDGRTTSGHVLHPLVIRPDLPPEVVLLQPERDLEAPANSKIPLLIQARDPDFELGYLYLNIEKAGQKIVHDQLSEGHQQKLTLKHEIELSKLNVAVGNVLDFWIEAYDNKQPKPNSKNTPKLRIEITAPVSPKEADQQFAEQNERRDQKLADANQELNTDGADNQEQKDRDPKDAPQNAKQEKDANGDRQENSKVDQPQDGQEGNAQSKSRGSSDKKQSTSHSKDGTSESKTAQKNGSGKNQGHDPQGQTGEDSNSKKPLENDGTQDEEILRRISEKLRKENSDKQTEANQSKASKSESKDENADSLNEAKPAEENSPNANEQPQSEKDSQPKNSSNQERSKPATDTNQSSEEQKSDLTEKESTKPNPSESLEFDSNDSKKNDPKTDQENSKRLKDKSTKNESASKKPESSDSTKKQETAKAENNQNQNADAKDKSKTNESGIDTGDKTQKDKSKSDETTSSKNDDNVKNESSEMEQNPKSNQDSKKQESNESDASSDQERSENDRKKTSDSNTGDAGSGKPKSEQPNDQNSDQISNPKEKKAQKSSETTDADSQKSQNPANENLPEGINKKTTKSGSDDQSNREENGQGSKAKKTGPQNKTSDPSKTEKADADGTESDVGKPDRDADNSPKLKANNNVKRDPNENPEIRPNQSNETSENPKDQGETSRQPKDPSQKHQPSSKPDDSREKMNDQDADSETAKNQNSDPENDPSGSKSKKPAKKSDPKQQDPSSGSKQSASQKSQKSASNEKRSAESKSEEGTNDADSDSDSDAKDGGKAKSQSKNQKAQGTKKDSSKQKQSDDRSNSEKQSDKQNPGESSSESSKKDESESEKESSDDANGKSEKSESGKNDSPKSDKQGNEGGNGKPGSKKSDKPGGKSSSKSNGPSSAEGMGNATGQNGSEPTSGGETPDAGEGDEANLEYNRRASELLLQKIKNDLERGETDPDLLEQLGWTETELKRFAERLSKSLNESKLGDDTAESKARQQQFQEMLKSLDLKSSGSQRTGNKEPKRDVDQVESKRTPPPAAYRSVIEKFTKDIARQKTTKSDKTSK